MTILKTYNLKKIWSRKHAPEMHILLLWLPEVHGIQFIHVKHSLQLEEKPMIIYQSIKQL